MSHFREEDDDSKDTQQAPLIPLTDAVIGPKRPCLLIVSGPKLGSIFVIEREMLIGREPKCVLCLNEDEGVSRRHARVQIEAGLVTVTDLGSSNGTFLGTKRLEPGKPEVLREGDKIRIGQTTVVKFAHYDTIEEQAQRQLVESALRDGLTQAFNRRYLLDRLASEIGFAKRSQAPVILILLDIDHLAEVNARLGHGAGDHVLRRTSELLAGAIRLEDVLARYGAEEFGVLAHGISVEQGMMFAERLRKQIATGNYQHDDKPIAVTVSVGLASFPFGSPRDDDDNTQALALDLARNAESALDRAKQAGRNQVCR